MKKRIFTILICMILCILPVYAASNNDGSSPNGNDSDATLAKEKRVEIKTNLQVLAQLREKMKAKINEQKTLLNIVRENN